MTIASQSETAVFPLPTPGIARVDNGLHQYLVGLATNLRKLQSGGTGGGISGTASDENLASIDAALADLEAAISALNEAIRQAQLTDATSEFDTTLSAEAQELLSLGQTTLATANEQAGRLASVGADMILRAFIEGLRNKYSIVNEAVVRSDLALTVEAVNASLGLSSATVQQISQAYANGDLAEAQSLNTVGTQIAGNTASVVTLSESVNGIEARWGVTVNAQGQVLGLVRLDGDASGSTFTVVANVFQVAQPSTTGGDPTTIFVIGNRNGSPALGIKGDMFLDGTIVARHLSVSSLSAITANLGTVTAGLIQSANGKVRLDLNAGTFEILA